MAAANTRVTVLGDVLFSQSLYIYRGGAVKGRTCIVYLNIYSSVILFVRPREQID